MNNYNYLLKFIIVGDICVGKSCLVLQFTDSKFRNEHDATIGVEFGSKYTTINDKRIKLQIWDTSGQEAFKSIVRSYYRGSIGGILVFDVTSRQSFENITKWNKEIQSYACDKIEMTLIQMKSAIIIIIYIRRQVSRDEAQAFAKREGFTYFETSAKTGENVNNVFEQMAKIILKRIDCGDIDPSQDVQLVIQLYLLAIWNKNRIWEQRVVKSLRRIRQQKKYKWIDNTLKKLKGIRKR
ncbi:unnamed protein product [Paramecium sonneborni]|uniref:Uncharacterized protein n=1 Tax=Paramecium sonneborni TaxID=65129 RepID=A0A8S1QP55_9CILI|nr:unnamed protein product [Paramecium sonneborni]